MKTRMHLIKGLSEEIRQSIIRSVGNALDVNTELYLRNDLLWLRYNRQIESILEITANGGKLLDIGCGVGVTTAIISSLNTRLNVTGTDHVQIEIWKLLGNYGAKYHVDDALNSAYEDASFDYCTAFGVMEHTADDVKFLAEIQRILKPGGYLFIFNLPSKYALFERLANLAGIKSHDRTYTFQRIKTLTGSIGFTILSAKKEFFLPAKVNEISRRSFKLYNKCYKMIDVADRGLTKPLNWFAQSFIIQARKS